jgi:vanillate/3-O-methylgallate O-demethylase
MNAATPLTSLQDVIDSVPSIARYLFNEAPGAHGRNKSGLTPVPPEVSNWREEQQAWRQSAVLFDQSHHMPELYVKGPDARRLLERIGVNSLANLRPGIAKQFVGCNPRGQIIGDCILYDLGRDTFELVSGKTLLNWVQFHAETGDYDVTVERDENTSDNPAGRKKFRFGMDGPNAQKIFEAVVEGGAPEIKFFNTAHVRIAGCDVLALRHGMAGHQGAELSGDYADGPTVRGALLAAGRDLGLIQGGTKAYYSSLLESGWIGYQLPAIYTGDDMRAFREWLPADGWEAKYQLGGSFYSDNIEDFYCTPYDLGYERIVKFDHDFIGREALERIAQNPPRRKVTLVWNSEDVAKVFVSLFDHDQLPGKYLEFPVSDYGFPHGDLVLSPSGEPIGKSAHAGYSANERETLSLATLDVEFATPGTEVVVVWGEPDGGSRKPQVEPHRQMRIRATVQPVPYANSVRAMKRAAIGSHTA